MPAYVILDVEVTDPDLYAEYRDAAPAVVEAHGGRYIVRGGEVEPVENEWGLHRVVVIEFPDVESARAWHSSDEYAPLLAKRERATRSRAVIIPGVDG